MPEQHHPESGALPLYLRFECVAERSLLCLVSQTTHWAETGEPYPKAAQVSSLPGMLC